jgi:hypothetical protein
MKKLYAKEGQTHCHECGKKFEIDRPWDGKSIYQSTTCPNGCRGSWVSDVRDSEFEIEFK